MKTIKSLAEYTHSKKEYQISKENYFYTEPMCDINKFINGENSIAGIGLALDFLSSWYHYNYIYSFAFKQNEYLIVEENSFSISTYIAIEANNWYFSLGKNFERYKRSIEFHKAIKHMAQALLLGWDELAVKYGHLLIKMLYGKQYEGWHPAYKHPWFMLEIFCKWQKIELDYSKLNYPKDMGVYIEALKCWDTTDTTLLAKIINDLTDFHIAESDENEYEDRTPDFPSSDYFIFPIEMLLWLNIRQRIGLPDYTPDNELMNMPINNWHTQQTEIPRIEIIERAKQKLLQDCPEISFEL